MKAAIKRLIAGPLRYAIRFVLQRPGLKTWARGMITRVPRLHGFLMRAMFQAPATTRPKLGVDQENLSPNARRAYRALRQSLRTYRR